jgi:hypothetical protein
MRSAAWPALGAAKHSRGQPGSFPLLNCPARAQATAAQRDTAVPPRTCRVAPAIISSHLLPFYNFPPPSLSFLTLLSSHPAPLLPRWTPVELFIFFA